MSHIKTLLNRGLPAVYFTAHKLGSFKYPAARLYEVDELARLPRASTQTGIMAGLKECVRRRQESLHPDVDVLSCSTVLL